MNTEDQFSLRVTELMKKKGVTQSELAQRMHMDQSALSKLLNGKRCPTAHIIVQFADHLQTTTDYLLGRTSYSGLSALVDRDSLQEYASSSIPLLVSVLTDLERDTLENVLFAYLHGKATLRNKETIS